VLYFSFTDPGRQGLREREKEKKKHWQICRDYLTLLPAVPSWQTDRQAGSSYLTQHQAVLHFKKLVLR
jgi:hypothetical protein